MKRILGLDLGTNSIGWAIRDTDISNNSQIIDYGTLVYEKGVGDGKNGEFSLAAERRENRSKRRLYNAKRYRKWALLKLLITNGMCPLTLEELKLWSVGNWKIIDGKWKNLARIYPIQNEDFQKWIAFDPVFFGDNGVSIHGKPIRKNPYDLRCELNEKFEDGENSRKMKIGRSLYHLAQRRGFKTSRKSGKSLFAKNEEIEEIKNNRPDFQISMLAKEKLELGERFRASGVIQRKYFEDEFIAICKKQQLDDELINKIHKAIYFVRPLRSQKGLVGNCTLEPQKSRIPISHPKYEEFRALQFINNIKWREKGKKEFVQIPISLKKKIFEELFFKRKKSGTIDERKYFKFDEIINKFSENGSYEFNYKNLPNVSTCPTIAALMNVFDNEWEQKFIENWDEYGINWDNLTLSYSVKYGKKVGLERKLNIDEIWHLLYDFIQTKDQQEKLEIFCKDVLSFSDEKVKTFSNIDIQQGYGSLSYKAISRILPFLRNGYIYSEAVLFANLKKVLGEKFETHKEKAKKVISDTILNVNKSKEELNIVNGLIQNYFANNSAPYYPKEVENEFLVETYQRDTINKLKQYYGENDWKSKEDSEKNELTNKIFDLFLKFLNGKQTEDEKSSEQATIDYYKLPRLDEAIKKNLKDNFNVSENVLKCLYHPSDIEMYSKSKTVLRGTDIQLLESPQPPAKGWKNPMAMRTLHELRHLLNYLLKVGKIDKKTKIVVEMARELNDANKRLAIQAYQRYREQENKEFAKAIIGVVKQKYPNVNENDVDNINKVRLWWEQVENNEEKLHDIKELKEDIEKYRLWKEQDCVCMYTGKMINITNLFDGTQTQIMHTFPASISFDNSLSNLTVGDAHYNNEIQKNKIPTELPNYNKDEKINGKLYSAIEPRLMKWKEKVTHLRNLIDENKKRTKKTQDIETKKGLIKNRHLLQFEYDYWKKKLDTFFLEEIPMQWKNSQLIDTQIISKYARAYLKTVFEKVDVQKGTIVNTFKKIYQIKGEEQKDRSKHSHHAIDAAVLTLIPSSAKREALLEEYFIAIENKQKFYAVPYQGYTSAHVHKIEDNILINHINRDKTLSITIKNIKQNKKKTGKVAKGDTIRGQLHKETFLGAIKVLERNDEGYPIRENNKYKIIKKKDGEDEIWIVSRKHIKDIKIDKDVIVDELLKKHIEKQLNKGVPLSDVLDFNNKRIRHIRTRVKAGVGYLSQEKAIQLKEHTYISKMEHKQEYRVQNEENYLFLLYEGINDKNKIIRHYRILNLFDIAQLKIKNISDINNISEFQTIKKGKYSLGLKAILKVGDRVAFFNENKEEIDEDNFKSRIYKIVKFNELGENTAYVYFLNQIEARQDKDLGNGGKIFIPEQYQPKLELTSDKLNCLFEKIDFKINLDGTITFFKK